MKQYNDDDYDDDDDDASDDDDDANVDDDCIGADERQIEVALGLLHSNHHHYHDHHHHHYFDDHHHHYFDEYHHHYFDDCHHHYFNDCHHHYFDDDGGRNAIMSKHVATTLLMVDSVRSSKSGKMSTDFVPFVEYHCRSLSCKVRK